MQTAALAELGLAASWSYEAIEVAPERFAALVASLPDDGFAGVNVTVPHKLAALELADEASAAAREIGAANTLSFGARRGRAPTTPTRPAIAARSRSRSAAARARARRRRLGPGRRLGAAATPAPRSRSGTAPRAGPRPSPPSSAVGRARSERRRPGAFDLLVNATSVGLAASNAAPACAPSDLKALRSMPMRSTERQIVVDLVYGPHRRRLPPVHERRRTVVDGLEVLVHQGAASLRIWTGLEPPTEIMRRAAREQQRPDGDRHRPDTCAPFPRRARRRRPSSSTARAERHARPDHAPAGTAARRVHHRRRRRPRLREPRARRPGDRRGPDRRRSPDELLVEQRLINSDQLSRAIAERYGLDHVDLNLYHVDMGAANLLSVPPPAATTRSRSATSTPRPCWWRWPTRRTCSPSTTSR